MPMFGHQVDACVAVVCGVEEQRVLAVSAAKHDGGDDPAQ